jgi:hypothetical protein
MAVLPARVIGRCVVIATIGLLPIPRNPLFQQVLLVDEGVQAAAVGCRAIAAPTGSGSFMMASP